jgi:2-polyprenyl-3-methyl-5-hydroxy-6-metoxy-1,4-benzoquinol methylase
VRVINSPPADAIAYHDSLAIDWEGRYRKCSFHTREAVLLQCLQGRDVAGHIWLDAGCGSGTLSRVLAQRGCRVLGVDASSAMVTAANELARFHTCSERLKFERVETIAQLEVENNSLDGVLCSSVLEYAKDPVACLSEFHRVLKPGGLLLVSVPSRNSVVRRAQWVCHRLGNVVGTKWAEFLDYSRNEYSCREFERRLVRAGFSLDKTMPFGSPLPMLAQRSRFWASLLMFAARKSG